MRRPIRASSKQLAKIDPGALWHEQVVSVTETEPGRIEIVTSLVDPRGDDGSREVRTAQQICKAALKIVKAPKPYISVLEADGTTFVVHGHSALPGTCVEN